MVLYLQWKLRKVDLTHERPKECEDLPRKKRKMCPVCSATLKSTSEEYSLRELLDLWKPIEFSQNVVAALSEQADFTHLFICPECKLEIFLPQIIGTPEFYSELSRQETLHYYEEDKWEFGEALKDLDRDASVIEMGCGSGSFLKKIKPFVSEVCGIEPNPHAFQVAQGNGLKVFGTAEDISELKGHFDSAFCFHVLEHVADPTEFLKSISLLVKPGGRIGISVPNQDGPVKFINPCIQNMPPHHATRWHRRTFRFLAEKSGLKIKRMICEPLTSRSHYYYSTYWVNHVLPQGLRSLCWVDSSLRRGFPQLFELLFRGLAVLRIRSFPLLKGQGLYVLLSTQGKDKV